jgi:ATP synthase protein I
VSDRNDERILDEIEKREARRVRAQDQDDNDRWSGLGMLGLVGWSFVLPMLVVVGIGIWVDTRTESPYSWSLMAVFVGAVIGGANAWYWIHHEQRKTEDKNE